jgi:serine/threonine-protein kinase
VGNYQLLEEVGAGGMGMVYRGVDLLVQREVAIKVLRPDLQNHPEIIGRFVAEAVTLAKLHHPHIALLYNFFCHDKHYFMVLEYLRGERLDQRIRRCQALACDQALELFDQTLAAIDYAHQQNVIHRDIKSNNIMITPTEGVKVMDFGVARDLDKERMTQQGAVIGTLEYMSPEQVRGQEPDTRSDIYSLGILLFEMVTGRLPFAGVSQYELMQAQINTPLPAARQFAPNLPEFIEQAIRRATAKRLEERFATVRDFRAALLLDISPPRRDSGSYAAPVETELATQKTERDISHLAATEYLRTGDERRLVEPEAKRGRETKVMARTAEETPSSQSGQQRIVEEPPPQRVAEEKHITDEAAVKPMTGKSPVQPSVEAPHQQPPAPRHAGEPESQRPVPHPVAEAPPRSHVKPPVSPEAPLPASDSLHAGQRPQQGAPIDPYGTTQLQIPPGFGKPDKLSQAKAPDRTTHLRIPQAQIPPKQRSAKPLVIGGAFAALIIIGIIFWSLLSGPSQPGGDPTPQPKPTPDMTQIPAGKFRMGLADEPVDPNLGQQELTEKYLKWMYPQWPAHEVEISAFAIDRNEVTNAEYAQFIEETNHEPPADWAEKRPPAGQERWPVRNVSFNDAQAFAEWRSKRDGVSYRLPTEEEWEYAAKGATSYRYPWGGDQWLDGRANVNTEAPRPVGSYPEGASGFGALDMLGNVAEWTSSRAKLYPNNTALEALDAGQRAMIVVRGGSYESSPGMPQPVSVTQRGWYPASHKSSTIGFRLIRPGP